MNRAFWPMLETISILSSNLIYHQLSVTDVYRDLM